MRYVALMQNVLTSADMPSGIGVGQQRAPAVVAGHEQPGKDRHEEEVAQRRCEKADGVAGRVARGRGDGMDVGDGAGQLDSPPGNWALASHRRELVRALTACRAKRFDDRNFQPRPGFIPVWRRWPRWVVPGTPSEADWAQLTVLPR